MDSTSPSNTIRRLSLQFGKKSHMMVQVTRNLLQHARSVVIFPFAVGQVPAAGSCRVLRVLDLEHCNLSLEVLGTTWDKCFSPPRRNRKPAISTDIGRKVKYYFQLALECCPAKKFDLPRH